MRVVVTGSSGFIGGVVMSLLERAGHEPVECDVGENVLSRDWQPEADAAIHLAAEKYAIRGETRPAETAELNVRGTLNVCRRVKRVVFASTTKAAAPITAYGASKLVAERVVLNAGGVVVRLVNVFGSSGSVAGIWAAVPLDEPLPVTDCRRMFITPLQAGQLLVGALDLPSGRYGPADFEWWAMEDLSKKLYPNRDTVRIPLRRGDRPVERMANDYETVEAMGGGYIRILDAWENTERKETCLTTVERG